MFREVGSNIFIANPFIYRIDPEDYICITENLLKKRKLFQEIDNTKKTPVNDENLIKKHSSLLKRWRNNQITDLEKMYQDFDTYRYFYKEVGASLKFNPLSEKDAGVHVLEKIFELLKKYMNLLTPKAVYIKVDIEPDDEGLQVRGSDIHFNSRKLRIFTSHSNLKTEKKILPKELIKEKVIVYVVTIGPGLDEEVKHLSEKGNIYDAYILNGIGAGAAEMVANDLNLYMNDNCNKNNCSYRRISPGYGDWVVSDQIKIFRLLQPEKNIGVKLTDSHIMLPEKSTSGIMGLISG